MVCFSERLQCWWNEHAVRQPERPDSIARTRCPDRELWSGINNWVLTGFVISGISDRSSRRWWWWRLHKQAAPPQAHKCCTFKHSPFVQRFDYTPQKFSRSGMEIPSWIGLIACCHGTMLIETKALSIADGASHQIVFAHFHNTTVI